MDSDGEGMAKKKLIPDSEIAIDPLLNNARGNANQRKYLISEEYSAR